MSDISHPARGLRRGHAPARPESQASRFRFFLLAAAAGVALSLGAHAAHADEVTWLGGDDEWGSTAGWDTSAVPSDADTANVSAGNVLVGGAYSIDTLNVSGGLVQVGADGVLSAATINLSGGQLTATGDRATINVSQLLTITNDGYLVNDTIVNAALDNAGSVDNYAEYNGDVASNAGGISNNAPGIWTGDVTNGTGSVTNYGNWVGEVAGNEGSIFNDGADAVWTGDVATNNSQITNRNGASWNGDVLGNTNVIFNREDSSWTGDVVAQEEGQIENYGAWKGDVAGNNGWIFQMDGSWEGDVLSNNRDILVMDGTWTGDVVTNEASIVNRAGVWTGDVLANTGTVQNDAEGIWIGDITNDTGALKNYGSWTGDVAGNSGFFFNDGEDAVWTGDVLASDSQISNQNGATWNGDVRGNNNALYNEAGSIWNGDVIANGGGSNARALIDNYGIWNGDVKGNAVTVYNDFEWNGDVTGNAGKVINYEGIWTGDVTGNAGSVSNRSGTSWNGDVTGNAGTIENRAGGTWTGAVLANNGIIDNKGVWNGAFTNAGTVNAENQINGAFDNSGTLNLTGSLAGITTLTNTGTVDLRGNGTVQTLSAANAIFGPNSVFALDVDAAGHSDVIVVSGTAALDGAVRVAAATGTPYDASTVYTILTAANVVGEFQSVTTDLAFLAPRLSYDTNSVELTLLRNDVGFGSVGTTANQGGTGGGVESLGAGNVLYDSILWLNADQAARAFDELSGEVHSSVEGANVQDAGLVADVMTDQMDAALDVSTEGGARVASNDAGFVPSFTTGAGTRVWGQIYGRHGRIEADGNVAGMKATSGGFAAGVDGQVADWRLGLMLQVGRSRNETPGLNSTADSTDYGVGIYGGRRWGRTGLSLGASYTRHDISSDRRVVFPGLVNSLSADYKAGTAQVFGKLSQRFEFDAVSLSPYASLAYVRNDTDGFTETGGPAALISAASHIDATFTTVGLSAARHFLIGHDVNVTARGKLGWRHTFSDTPTSSHRFAGGTDFTVAGAPIDGDTLITGVGFDLNDISSLDVSYEERIGDGAKGRALMGTWAVQF